MARHGIVFMLFSAAAVLHVNADEPWPRHTIDDASRGADGVRLGDVDLDGRLDIVTGWEEGGRIRICFRPPVDKVRQRWPSIEIGAVKSPEDAVFADVNRDGWPDVVSCCEGREQTIYFHLNPGRLRSRVRDPAQWKTSAIADSVGVTRWMFCEPLVGETLIIGSKQPNARIVQYQLQQDGSGTFRQLRESGWIMSLRGLDLDGDGDEDIVYSDRKGAHRGVGWLECVGNGAWHDHVIGGADAEVMFLHATGPAVRRSGSSGFGGPISGRPGPQIFCDTRNGYVLRLTPGKDLREPWLSDQIKHPDGIGGGKAVCAGDLDGDGDLDLACTCEHAAERIGVYWLENPGLSSGTRSGSESTVWSFHEISSNGQAQGIKFDRIELNDVDEDGDLDLITCEERDNLGVIWYENPVILDEGPPTGSNSFPR